MAPRESVSGPLKLGIHPKAPQVWAAPEEADQLKRFFAAAAFLYSCAISRQVITALAPRHTLRNSEFASFMAGHLGLLPPLLADAVGKQIRAPTAGGKSMQVRGVVDARGASLMSQVFFEATHNIRHDDFCNRLATIGEEAGWLCTREADRLVWSGVGVIVGVRVEAAAATFQLARQRERQARASPAEHFSSSLHTIS